MRCADVSVWRTASWTARWDCWARRAWRTRMCRMVPLRRMPPSCSPVLPRAVCPGSSMPAHAGGATCCAGIRSFQPFFRPHAPRHARRACVVGCAARKAALAREGWTEALTVREAALRLIRGGMRPVRGMPCAPGGPGWLERVFLRADRLAGGDCKPLPSFVPERRFAGVETAVSLCWAAMCASRAYAEPLRWNACWGPSVPMRCPGR